jgi:hypothetical protein
MQFSHSFAFIRGEDKQPPFGAYCLPEEIGRTPTAVYIVKGS